jgi:transposase
MSELFWLNDRQWAAIEKLLPHLGGKPRVDDRRVISGILHRFREGLRWRALPEAYGPRTTVFNRFNRWSERGLWQELFATLVACEDPPMISMADSTSIKAHRSAAGGKGGPIARLSVGRAVDGRRKSTHLPTNTGASTPCS